MNVFVDGATGFVGSHLARVLVRGGHAVAALVRPGASRQRLADLAAELHVIEGSLDDAGCWTPRLAAWQPAAAVHLAWDVTPGKYLNADSNHDCVANSLRWLAAVSSANCRRWMMVGTCLEYAAGDRPLGEETPVAPASLYARCKNEVHTAARDWAARSRADLTWCRLFHLYGPWEDRRRLVPSVACGLLRGERVAVTNGRQVCDYLHVEDVAQALASVVESRMLGTINICSGRPVTVAEVVQQLAASIGRPDLIDGGGHEAPVRPTASLCGVNERLVRSCGWRPRWSLEAGLGQAVAWWREHLETAAAGAT